MKRKRRVKKRVLNVLLVIFLLVFLYSSYNALHILLNRNSNNKEVKKIQEEVITNKKEIEEVKEDEELPELTLDFKKLNEINSDTVGWIRINNTNINYPIVQAKDNDYYLKHSFYKRYNENGWIFLNSINSSSFNDLNTVVFGHDTRSRSMFSDLIKLYDGLLGDNIPITIYTEQETYHYKTFAIFLTEENDNEYLKNYLSTDSITKAIKNSKYDFKTAVLASDNILTLQTCYHSPKQKVILLAVRT